MPDGPTFDLGTIPLYVARTVDHTFDLYQNDGETELVISASDNVRCKLWIVGGEGAAPALDFDSVGPHSATFTADAGTDLCTSSGHELDDGDLVRLTTTGTLPTGLSTGTNYYVRDSTATTFKLAATSGGSAIDITGAGSGTHTWTVYRSKITINTVGVAATTPAQVTCRFHQLDTDGLTAGNYRGELLLIDADDVAAYPAGKPLCRFDATVEGSGLGDMGIA